MTKKQKVIVVCGTVFVMAFITIISVFAAVTMTRNWLDNPYRVCKIYVRVWANKNLKDPSSLKIGKILLIEDSEKELMAFVDYRAKNGYGGYTSNTRIFIVNKKEQSVTSPVGSD